MNKTFLVLKNEILTTLRRPSFLLSLFGIPLIAGLIFAGVARLNQDTSTQAVIIQAFTAPQSTLGEGYVDQSGIIQSIPPSVPAGSLIAYSDEASAQQAITNGEISAYYVLPADYLETGKIIYLRPDFNPLSSSDRSDLFEWVVQVNLLGGDMNLATLINGPKQLEQVSLDTEPQRDINNPLTFLLPYAVTILFYVIILGAASLLLSSVTKEKENRVLEILMVSITPQQMLNGKIIGLGILGLFQTVIWVGTGRVILAASGETFSLPAVFQLPTSFMVWALIFFILGYTLYASLMAGLGALVPNMREASQATILVVFPLIIPMFLINLLIEAPHGLPSVIMSIFPLTAPVAMMARLAAGGVPFWQPVLAALLLAFTAMLVLRAVAGMFRAQALLSGQQFSLKLYFNALLGKA
jgi:ABC-2 type transport system permease protein